MMRICRRPSPLEEVSCSSAFRCPTDYFHTLSSGTSPERRNLRDPAPEEPVDSPHASQTDKHMRRDYFSSYELPRTLLEKAWHDAPTF